MSDMFNSALSFDGTGLSKWNVRNVRYMNGLFEETFSFTGTISSWQLENVVDVSRLFQHASAFSGDLSGWSVERVENFDYAFRGARLYNRDLSGWSVASGTSFISMVGVAGSIGSFSRCAILTSFM